MILRSPERPMATTYNRRDWMLASALAPLALRPFLARAEERRVRSSPIRLHSNENPYGPSQSAQDAMTAAFGESNLYPYTNYRVLEELIAEREGVTPDHVVLGAGSHEVLRMTAMTYGLSGGEVVTAYPTFEGLERYAHTINAKVHRVPVDENMLMDLPAIDQATTDAVKLVFLCNPNNPTGTITPDSELRPLVESLSERTAVLVDEAYYELVTDPGYATMVPLVKQGRQVIVSRTFSKVFGLAGLRVGYAITTPAIAERLESFRTSASVNIVGLRAAIAAYQDMDFLNFSRSSIASERDKAAGKLQKLGYHSVPSHTNFLFFHLGSPIQEFQEAMAERGILVGRPFPPFLDWCRLSVGKPEEMHAFLEAFGDVMQG